MSIHMFNVAQALLWIGNYQSRKFKPDGLKVLLAHLANPRTVQGRPCAPSLFVVDRLFSKGADLPPNTTMKDIQEALRVLNDEGPCPAGGYPAPSILQGAHDDFLHNLFNRKLEMNGREVRQPETFRLENGARGSIEYLPGRGPTTYLDFIPAAEFAELRFIDREGIEVVPLDFPAREFPRWRDLWVAADDVRRLWPIETPDAGKKRGPAPALTESVKARMRQYDPGELAKMKGSEMASTFGASATICYAARRSVQSELKTPCNSE